MTSPANPAPPTVSIYNPANLKKEDLIRGFVARQPLLDRLLNDLRREGPGVTPQHHLLIGQRGLGKTTLLRRLAFAVEDDPVLAATWMPLVFPEEQYNVASLGDFWLNCADALSDALDRAGDHAASQSLDERVERVPADRAGRSVAALQLLMEEADRLQRRFLLLVDNLDILLDRLDQEQEWEFRRVISEELRLHFIGASSRVLEALYQHGRAFYDFFQVHELKGLDDTETFAILRRLAGQSGEAEIDKLIQERPGRIRALRLLTGGNPRTLVLLFKVLTEARDGDVQRDVEQLLDLYTPLYKARFEELPAQAQQLVDAMAIHWDPLTAADLTELLRPLSVNQVSAQLKRLDDLGVVEKAPWFGEKKTAFQITERFFNIWYLMRASRRVRRKLLWLVKFLEAWFDQEELSTRARGFLDRGPQTMGRERYAEMAFAYSQTVPDRHLRRNLESAGLHAVIDDGLDRLIDFSDLPPELQDKKDRMQQLLEFCDRLSQSAESLSAALNLVQQAHELVPGNRDTQFLLAQLLTLAGKWHEASPLLEQLAGGDGEFSSTGPFRAVVETGHIADAVAILERTGADQRWRPLYEALRAAAAGSPAYLNRVAPEVRTVARKILGEISPRLFSRDSE
jgi:hypothetical protein